MSDIENLKTLIESVPHDASWTVLAREGKPVLNGGNLGNVAAGYIATWKEFDLIAALLNHLPEISAALGVPMACTGCGCMESVEEIRAKHPKALSCCPERKMVPAADLIDELQKRPLESTVNWYAERAFDLKRYSDTKNYVAMEALMTELILDAGQRAGFKGL